MVGKGGCSGSDGDARIVGSDGDARMDEKSPATTSLFFFDCCWVNEDKICFMNYFFPRRQSPATCRRGKPKTQKRLSKKTYREISRVNEILDKLIPSDMSPGKVFLLLLFFL